MAAVWPRFVGAVTKLGLFEPLRAEGFNGGWRHLSPVDKKVGGLKR